MFAIRRVIPPAVSSHSAHDQHHHMTEPDDDDDQEVIIHPEAAAAADQQQQQQSQRIIGYTMEGTWVNNTTAASFTISKFRLRWAHHPDAALEALWAILTAHMAGDVEEGQRLMAEARRCGASRNLDNTVANATANSRAIAQRRRAQKKSCGVFGDLVMPSYIAHKFVNGKHMYELPHTHQNPALKLAKKQVLAPGGRVSISKTPGATPDWKRALAAGMLDLFRERIVRLRLKLGLAGEVLVGENPDKQAEFAQGGYAVLLAVASGTAPAHHAVP